MRHALAGLQPSGGTAIYDAVARRRCRSSSTRTRQRAAILIISDGADTASDATLRDVRSALLRSDAFVYAIAIDSPERQPINTQRQRRGAARDHGESGGRTEIVLSSGELAAAAARIAEELNSQYVLGYTLAAGRRRPVSQHPRPRGRRDYRVRARNGYVATPVGRRARASS